MLKTYKNFLLRNYIKAYGKTHKIGKRVLFSSFAGRQYSDNPRAVSEKMHEMYPEYEIEWYFNDEFDHYDIVPDYVKVIKGSSLSLYKSLATAAAYVSNETFAPHFYKKPEQCFVQVWHGDRGFKKILYDSVGKNNGYIYEDNKLVDFCTAGSDFMEGVFRSALNYSGEILNVGIPRNDKLIRYDLDERNAIRKKLGIENAAKLLLYAPTYRKNSGGADAPFIDLNDTVKHLSANGEKWVCAVRAHIGSHGIVADEGYMDLSDYPDMAELLLAADMLISDYSSCAGDFILTDKPVILAHFDREEYLKNSRKFYFDPDTSGYVIAKNQDELNRIIDTYSAADYIKSNEAVRKFYRVTETGKAAETICKRIDEICKSRERAL